MDREEARRVIRRAMERYRGGRFETGASGGAAGMIMFYDRACQQYYLGGFKPEDAKAVTDMLNAMLVLLG